MSSPREVRRSTGIVNASKEDDSHDLNFQKTLPSSSQKKTPAKKVFGNKVNSEKVKSSHLAFSSKNYDFLFQEPSESESDDAAWDVNDFYRTRWKSMDTEPAGPSKTVSPVLPDSLTTRQVNSWQHPAYLEKKMSIKEPPYGDGFKCIKPATGQNALVSATDRILPKIGKLGCRQSRWPNSAKTGDKQMAWSIEIYFFTVQGTKAHSQGVSAWIDPEALRGAWRSLPSNAFPIDIETTVSEKELTQLAQIKPLIFNNSSLSALRESLKMLQKKEDFDIIHEFLELEQMTMPDDFNCGNQVHNRDKNRYRDILPYDSTRVPLGNNKDYINASYIKIVNHEEEYFYIATQGPLPDTKEDFWQMVMENNCNVIAMITREIEGGIIKCYSYWPISLNEPLELKHFRVFLENSQITQYFIIRVFQIVKKSTGMSHSVKHLQFTKWPDHGTPASADFFIKYVRYVRKSHITGPLLVHCSAGVGRTGVFMCVDVVFSAIEKNYSFNIMNIVTQMRKQRFGMIQTKEQYHFCYQIVVEVLQNLLDLN